MSSHDGFPSSQLDYSTETAADTIELLETRLRRLEYVLTGESTGLPLDYSERAMKQGSGPSAPDSVATRLAALEEGLRRLVHKAPAVRDVIGLYARFPDLFQTPSTESELPSTLPQHSIASIILSYASAFPETASRLTSLKDLPVPPASASAALVELQPRLDKLIAKYEQQAREVAELRTHSAMLIQRWVEVGVVGTSEVWGEWEARLVEVERAVRRQEVRAEREI